MGDSYNDISMLQQADAGFLFRPPNNVIKEFPEFPVCYEYAEIEKLLKKFDVI
jgi:phosphoserine/homoserine phosphotransferase